MKKQEIAYITADSAYSAAWSVWQREFSGTLNEVLEAIRDTSEIGELTTECSVPKESLTFLVHELGDRKFHVGFKAAGGPLRSEMCTLRIAWGPDAIKRISPEEYVIPMWKCPQ